MSGENITTWNVAADDGNWILRTLLNDDFLGDKVSLEPSNRIVQPSYLALLDKVATATVDITSSNPAFGDFMAATILPPALKGLHPICVHLGFRKQL